MKKTVGFVLTTLMGVNAAHASEGRIFLSSGDRQVNMIYQAPQTSAEDELNEAINRLSAQAQSASDRAFLAAQHYNRNTPSAQGGAFSSNLVMRSSDAPNAAARNALLAAHRSSVGRCALYVRRALQAAGYRFTPQASAYMYAHGALADAGFVKIDHNNYTPQVGDVAVFNRTSRNPHGHIQIYDGAQWVSDFVQPKFSPYSQHNGYSVWRDARYISNQGIYLALND